MRHLARIGLGFALAFWIAYAISPYVALYRLARAVEARDVATIRELVNLRALRISLARQIVPEYLKLVEEARALKPSERDLAVSVGATVADPLIAQLLAPEALVELLEDGWPRQAEADRPAGSGGFEVSALRQIGRVFLASETRGFRVLTVTLPETARPEEQYRLRLRFSRLSWRVIHFELPAALRQSLARQLPRPGA